ncbi:MAG: hypothetical protein U0165_05735 [Polyangiaceae bacterium]
MTDTTHSSSAFWPLFWSERVLCNERALIAVDVPSGLSLDRASPATSVEQRVTRFVEVPEGVRTSVAHAVPEGVTGVGVIARNDSALASFSQANAVITLSMIVQRDRDLPRVKLPASAPRVVRRGNGFALVEIDIRTASSGATSVRYVIDMFASSGCPVVGDVANGGAPAPRLLAHVSSIRSDVLAGSPSHTIVAPLPSIFERWCSDHPLSDEEKVVEAIHAALGRRYALSRSLDTDVFRVAHEAGDRVPGLAIDWYAGWAVVHIVQGAPPWMAKSDAILDAVAQHARGVYLKIHPKQLSNVVDPRRDDLAPTTVSRGEPAPSELVVRENGVRYRVSLSGRARNFRALPRSARENRARVKTLARRARVESLFVHACSPPSRRDGRSTSSVSVDSPYRSRSGRRELERERGSRISRSICSSKTMRLYVKRALAEEIGSI